LNDHTINSSTSRKLHLRKVEKKKERKKTRKDKEQSSQAGNECRCACVEVHDGDEKTGPWGARRNKVRCRVCKGSEKAKWRMG